VASVRFSRFVLRTTTAVEAAAAFYDAVLQRRGDGIFPLHEAAIARGARPHWLGLIDVREIGGAEALAAKFVERGATRFGPPQGVADFVVLRDPGGAVVALTDGAYVSSAGVAWHQLNAENPESTAASYSALLGWSASDELDLGPLGRHRPFAFASGEPNVGLISDVAGRPGVHTHWLFFFSVPSLDRAVEAVRAHEGTLVAVVTLPNDVRLAVCDDPQGAAFGLIEPADAARLGRGA
jgi:predicted enzyme related to lactoylglutathione lyase